jgi:hypothetical protein
VGNDGTRSVAIEQMNAQAAGAAKAGAKIEKLGTDGVMAVNMDVNNQAGAQSFRHGQV